MDTINKDAERKSLEIGKWGNLFMGIAGVVAAILSRSDALLVDGLYSGVNFISAIIAARISVSVARPPDRRYPFGYNAQEALYVTFRSLVLLGILIFAVFGAIRKIYTYATGGKVPELVLGPILVYVVIMVAICFLLAAWHRHNWKKTGRQSDLLKTESKAAVVDGIISAGAGGGLLATTLLRGTALDFIIPVSDALIVLIMCSFIIREPIKMLLGSLGEVAGKTAEPGMVEKVNQGLQQFLLEQPYTLRETIVTKLGRVYFVISYIQPEEPVLGNTVDQLWQGTNEYLNKEFGLVKSEVIITDEPPFIDHDRSKN